MDNRHPAIADPAESVLVLVDCQERLWKVIHERDALEARLLTLLRGAAALEIPILVTEQNPKGLGPTLPSLREAAGDATVLSKMTFSCFGDDGFREQMRRLDRETLVVAGIEAHICVAQTALDTLGAGFSVQVVADGCGSRNPRNLGFGLTRMDRAGTVITTVESLLFDWMQTCEHEKFKTVAGLLK